EIRQRMRQHEQQNSTWQPYQHQKAQNPGLNTLELIRLKIGEARNSRQKSRSERGWQGQSNPGQPSCLIVNTDGSIAAKMPQRDDRDQYVKRHHVSVYHKRNAVADQVFPLRRIKNRTETNGATRPDPAED